MKTLILLFIFHSASLFSSSAPLRVGMELSYPPFEMICYDGSPCGISPDLVHYFGEFLGREVQIDNIPFIGLIPSLKNGNIDLIVSSLTVTEQRKKAIDFSEPYAKNGLSLLLGKDSVVNDITQLNEKGRTVVVKSGSSGEIYAMDHLNNATVHVLDKEASCVLEVVQGKADAFIYDQLSVYNNWQKNKSTTRVNLTSFQTEYWAFGFSKNNDALAESANQFIQKFRAEGGFKKLAEKYLPEQKKAFEEMGVPFVF